jgi:hypothetical protein
MKFTEGNATMMQHSQLETGTVGCTTAQFQSALQNIIHIFSLVRPESSCYSNFSGRALKLWTETYPAVDFQWSFRACCHCQVGKLPLVNSAVIFRSPVVGSAKPGSVRLECSLGRFPRTALGKLCVQSVELRFSCLTAFP